MQHTISISPLCKNRVVMSQGVKNVTYVTRRREGGTGGYLTARTAGCMRSNGTFMIGYLFQSL